MRSYVALVCALALLLATCGGSTDAVPPSTVDEARDEGATESPSTTQALSSTTAAPLTTTLPEPAPPAVDIPVSIAVDSAEWVSVDGEMSSGLDVVGGISDVVAVDGVLVAVGQVCGERVKPEQAPPWPCSPAVWVSADGVDWSRYELEGLGSLMTVDHFNGSLVAGGQYCGTVKERTDLNAVGSGLCRPGIWVAESPESWSRVSGDEVFPACGPQDDGCQLAVWDLAAGDDVVVAVGHDWGTATRVWRSTNAIDWERANDTSGTWPDGGWGWSDAVHAVDGAFVVLGNACSNDFYCHAAIWVGSPMADEWSHIGNGSIDDPYGPEAEFWATQNQASTSDGATVWMIGNACEGYEGDVFVSIAGCEPTMWTTDDGQDWAVEVINRQLAGQGDMATRVMFADGSTLHATGVDGFAETDEIVRWYMTSPTATLAWQESDFITPENNVLSAGIAVENGVVIVGSHAPPGIIYDPAIGGPDDHLKPIIWLRIT